MRDNRGNGRFKPARGDRNGQFDRRARRDYKRDRDEQSYRAEGGYENVVAGRNAAIETLKTGSRVDTVFIMKGASGGSIGKIVALAKEGGYPIKEVSAEKLEEMAGPIHQGVVVTLSAVEYAEVSDILARRRRRGKSPLSSSPTRSRTPTTSGH